MLTWKAAAGFVAAIGLVSATTPAWAGEPVYGYGSTRAEAAANANNEARTASQRKFGRRDCITPVRPDTCRQDGSGWICIAHVANHRGSCG